MATGPNFWDQFNDDEFNAGYSTDIIYTGIPERFHGIFENTVMDSPTYFLYSDDDKQVIAEDFYEYFVYGGGGIRPDQDTWLGQLGLVHEQFEWNQWGELYDTVHG